MLMRVVSKHLRALDRQVRESIYIENGSRNEKGCLKLKNEWAGTKVPIPLVTSPKGTSRKNQKGEGTKRVKEKETETPGVEASKRQPKKRRQVGTGEEADQG